MTLAWTKAVAVRGMRISADEDAAGWPACFQIHRLAILQCPADVAAQRILHKALFKDCESGTLKSARTVDRSKTTTVRTPLHRGTIGSEEWHSRDFLGGTLTVRALKPGKILLGNSPVEVVDHRVSASAFSQWLKINEQEPSEHIAAWFADQLKAPRTSGLIGEVLAAAENDAIPLWLDNMPNGAISVVHFLAVVLCANPNGNKDAEKDEKIITDWYGRLCEAASVLTGGLRLVQPHDRLTLLPMKGNPSGHDWLLPVDDADKFLETCGAGWRCSQMLTLWREHYGLASASSTAPAGAAPAPAPGKTFPVDQLPAHTKGDVWPDAAAQVVQKWLSENGRGALTAAANFYGVQPSALSSVLARVKKSATTLDSWSKSRKTA